MAKRLSPDRLAGRIERLFDEKDGLRLLMSKIEDKLRIRRGDRTAFLLALHGLEQDGRLRRDTRGRYYRPDGMAGHSARRKVSGKLTSLHSHFGFVTLDDGKGDCFIHGDALGDALPGDRVTVTLGAKDSRGLQGRIAGIEERRSGEYTGRLREEHRRLFVTPMGGFRYDLPVMRRLSGESGAVGDMVGFSVQRNRAGDWAAVVLCRYGSGESAQVCSDALLDEYGIPTEFSDELLEEAEKKAQLPLRLEEEHREDLRQLPILTIDGADAKDLDDAVSLQRLENGWLLGVHIADVSYYVTPGSLLDEEALNRATSVYFADRVIPMLPPVLCNGACSLQAGEDKRAFSAFITLDAKGQVQQCRLTKSLICSRVRGVYSEVNALFAGVASPETTEKYRPVADMLQDMRELSELLGQASHRRGVMQLAGVESRIMLDENGVAVGIEPRATGEAEQLIERFMITANTAVAALARRHKLPFVYRIHEGPNTERLGQLFDLARVKDLPVPLSAEEVTQKQLQVLLEAAADTPYKRIISDQLLRCMAKAKYDPKPVGHFGLVLKDYCHFTSPIRRYPDLMIHRILGRWLAGDTPEKLHDRLDKIVSEAAFRSSVGEVRSMTAERACEGCYKAEYMRQFLGDTFDGVVVSVTGAGLFVELPNTVSGLLPIEDLPEPFLEYDGMASLADALGRPRYTVGQPMTVQVAACDIPGGRVRFAYVPKEQKNLQKAD